MAAARSQNILRSWRSRLAALEEERSPAAVGDGDAVGTPPEVPGAAMRTVAAAFTAVSERRFVDLAELLSPDIDWRGIREPDGGVPRCVGREEAIDRMRVGLLAGGQVSVSSFAEDGNNVLAHVHHLGDDHDTDGDELPRAEWFVVAEVHDGLIVRMCGYATELEARAALSDETAADGLAGGER